MDIRFSRANVYVYTLIILESDAMQLYLSEFSYMSFSLFETTKLFVDFMNFRV